jgi:septal ring-binding cell division protein DamX
VIVNLPGDPPLPIGLRVDVSFDHSSVKEANTGGPGVPAPPQGARPSEAAAEPNPAQAAASAAAPAARPELIPASDGERPPGPAPDDQPALPSPAADNPDGGQQPLDKVDSGSGNASGLEKPVDIQSPPPIEVEQSAASSAVPQSAHSLGTGGAYTLQFASCSTDTCAAAIVSTLAAHGVSAGVIRSRDRDGREWFTVRAGAFRDASAAAAAAGELNSNATAGPAAVVVRGRGPV